MKHTNKKQKMMRVASGSRVNPFNRHTPIHSDGAVGIGVLPEEVCLRLQKIADQAGCSIMDLVLEAILAYFDQEGIDVPLNPKRGYTGNLGAKNKEFELGYEQGYDAGWQDAFDELKERVDFAFRGIE